MSRARTLILASASPQRRALLAEVGIPFEVHPAGIDETPVAGELPRDHVLRVARGKARAVADRIPDRWVLGSDTVIDLDGEILGKPDGEAGAVRMLERLSGRGHRVWTGIALCHNRLAREIVEAVATTVVFRTLSPGEIDEYARSGEPLDKAGAYGIQGLGSALVDHVEGSFSNVVGLPVERLLDILRELRFAAPPGAEPNG